MNDQLPANCPPSTSHLRDHHRLTHAFVSVTAGRRYGFLDLFHFLVRKGADEGQLNAEGLTCYEMGAETSL